ncbi:MAG: asparagine synthase (glutamine-hydrolyzing) [Alphaproteobacteria bacterium]|nr:asparagine synthase (glutamine-hydrolyzing) [Alphaproteobacteria bacterium]
MCGLFGFVNLESPALSPAEIDAGRRALDTLIHRGPDQHSDYIHGNVYMGHRRLSILDLSEEGRQPMIAADQKTVITVNGEIYNFKSIRATLGENLFRSQSDSEVMLHGYRAYGLATLLEKMDGMYAGVIFDARQHHLHFVRDRAGIKPLLYARIGPYFIWASELKAITEFARALDISLREDNTALYDFLTYRYIPGAKTLYKNVYNLEPASTLTLDLTDGQMQILKYWSLQATNTPIDHDKAAEKLRALILESVQEQMVSDVPVGFFLSGGMDSSILVSQAAKTRGDLSTFSIGYDHKAHDETRFAQMVATRFKTQHHTEILSGADAENLIPMILNWYDQPFGDNSALPTYHVSRFARKNATVALSGDGGDELFGGYRWYKRFAQFQNLQKPLRALGGFPRFTLAHLTGGLAHKLALRAELLSHTDPLELYALLIDGLPPSLTQAQRHELEIPHDYDTLWHFRRFYRADLPARKRMQFVDFHTFLPDDILTKVDRVSMAVSLEARVPFLSRKIIEFAFSLPEDFLYKNGALKGGLKYAFKDELPPEIITRPKKGFSIPLHIWKGAEANNRRFQESVYAHYCSNIKNRLTKPNK